MREKTERLPYVLDRAGVLRVLDVGRQFDVNRGGYADARSGCVNFWCGPGDKPAGWDVPITKGGLDYRRAYVGAMYFDWQGDDSVRLYVDASPYDLEEAAKRRGGWRAGVTDAQLAACLAWVRGKAEELLRLAALHPDVVGTRCPLCDYVLPTGELLNGLVEHVTVAHPPTQVTGLVLGEPCVLDTGRGRFELQAVERF